MNTAANSLFKSTNPLAIILKLKRTYPNKELKATILTQYKSKLYPHVFVETRRLAERFAAHHTLVRTMFFMHVQYVNT